MSGQEDTIFGVPCSELGVWPPEVYFKLGLELMKFIDRMGDHCPEDPAEKICDEAYAAFMKHIPHNRGPEVS